MFSDEFKQAIPVLPIQYVGSSLAINKGWQALTKSKNVIWAHSQGGNLVNSGFSFMN